jgi:ribosomal protein S18 acetylase RimI-like enzyme
MAAHGTLTIRPLELADAAAIASLHIETWRDTYRGLMPDSKLDALNVQEYESGWNRILSQKDSPTSPLTLGAFQGSILLGIASAGRPRESWGYDSELWAINIPKRFQKMGAGKAMLRACVQHVQTFNAKNMYLYCVLGNTNAENFYRKMGAMPTQRISQDDGYQERAWVWDDLSKLVKILDTMLKMV